MKKLPRSEQRDGLTGEHAIGDIGQILFGVLFLATWIADTFFLKYTVFLNYIIPYTLRGVIGGVCLIASGVFVIDGHKQVFFTRRSHPAVIREGVFGLVRHPVYLGEILFYAGLMLISLSIAAGLVLIGAVAFLVFIAQYEEKCLLERFGGQYSDYMQAVPMLRTERIQAGHGRMGRGRRSARSVAAPSIQEPS